MSKRSLIILATLSLSASLGLAQSTVVNYSAALGERDVYYQNAAVPDGNQVRIGAFDLGFNVQANAASLSALDQAWNQYGLSTITTLLGEPGHFVASQSVSSPALNMFNNQKIYMWILKTTDNALPAADFSNVEGYGLFSSSDPTWYFPAYGASYPANKTDITTLQVNETYFGSFDPTHLNLSPVPEPSTALGLILGLASLLAFRKRGAAN